MIQVSKSSVQVLELRVWVSKVYGKDFIVEDTGLKFKGGLRVTGMSFRVKCTCRVSGSRVQVLLQTCVFVLTGM